MTFDTLVKTLMVVVVTPEDVELEIVNKEDLGELEGVSSGVEGAILEFPPQ